MASTCWKESSTVSDNIKKRAYNKIKCERINDVTWRTWGGVSEHIVTDNEDGTFNCDCNDKVCSHRVKVGMQLELDFFTEYLCGKSSRKGAGTPPSYRTVKYFLKKNKFVYGDIKCYQKALTCMLSRTKYSPESEEIIAENVYRFAKGK
jgi:hypothetical protein